MTLRVLRPQLNNEEFLTTMAKESTLDKVTNLAKRRGFVFNLARSTAAHAPRGTTVHWAQS